MFEDSCFYGSFFFLLPFLNLHNIIAQPVEYLIFVGKSLVKKWVGFSVKARVVSTIQWPVIYSELSAEQDQ